MTEIPAFAVELYPAANIAFSAKIAQLGTSDFCGHGGHITGKTSQPDLLRPSFALRARKKLSEKVVISSWRFTVYILMVVPGPGVICNPIAHDATEQMRKCRTTRAIWLMTTKL